MKIIIEILLIISVLFIIAGINKTNVKIEYKYLPHPINKSLPGDNPNLHNYSIFEDPSIWVNYHFNEL